MTTMADPMREIDAICTKDVAAECLDVGYVGTSAIVDYMYPFICR